MITKGRRKSTNVQDTRGNPRAKDHMFRGMVNSAMSEMMKPKPQKKPNLKMGSKAGMPGMRGGKQGRVKKGK